VPRDQLKVIPPGEFASLDLKDVPVPADDIVADVEPVRVPFPVDEYGVIECVVDSRFNPSGRGEQYLTRFKNDANDYWLDLSDFHDLDPVNKFNAAKAHRAVPAHIAVSEKKKRGPKKKVAAVPLPPNMVVWTPDAILDVDAKNADDPSYLVYLRSNETPASYSDEWRLSSVMLSDPAQCALIEAFNRDLLKPRGRGKRDRVCSQKQLESYGFE
jgi:hypothetical protein